ncbi:MAG: GNAT family N-acetyltransferase [Clostridia bacterium]|nr:GNAT family N-acetyltransferase [Clostridia bacterium]
MEGGDTVILRKLGTLDRARICEWLSDSDIRRWFGDRAAPRSGPCTRAWGIWRVSPAAGAELIGWVELRDINRRAASAELCICIGCKELWGRGYGTAAILQTVHLAFERLKLRELYLRVGVDNARAIRAYFKCGFRAEGILRAGRHAVLGMKDHLLMSLRRGQSRALALDSLDRHS